MWRADHTFLGSAGFQLWRNIDLAVRTDTMYSANQGIGNVLIGSVVVRINIGVIR